MADRIEHAKIVALLAETLGDEKAQGAWSDAVRGVGIPLGDGYTREQALGVLQAIASAQGRPGVAAKLARVRLDQELRRADGPTRVPPSGERRAVELESTPVSATPVDLLPFLTPSLGDEKAREALQHYTRLLGITSPALTRDEAVQLLDAMSGSEGLLGIVARFAKARFLLRSR